MLRSLMLLIVACIGIQICPRALYANVWLYALPADSIPVAGKVLVGQQKDLINLLVDSLNKRPRKILQSLPDVGAMNPLGHTPSLNKLNDTIKQELFRYVADSYGAARLSGFSKGLNVLKDTAAVQNFIAEKLRGFYALAKPDVPERALALPTGVQNKFKGAGAEISYGDTSHAVSGWWNKVSVADEIAVGSIPFTIDYTNLSGYDYFNSNLNDRNLFKTSFDKKAYLKKLDSHIKQQYDLKKYFLEDIDFKAHMRAFLDTRLADAKERSEALVNGQKNGFLQIVNPDQLMNLDSVQLRNVLLQHSGLSGGEQALLQRKQELTNALAAHASRDSASALLEDELARYEAVDQYYRDVLKIKKDIGSGGLDASTLLNQQAGAKDKMNQWLGDKSNTPQLARQLLPLGIMQKIMLSMRNLDMGNIVANASKGSVSDLFMTGISGSALHNGKFMMATIGQRNDIGMQHTGLSSSIATPRYNLQFARMGTGDIGGEHTHVSVLNATTKSSSQGNFNMASLSQNLFAGSVSKQVELGKYGTLEAELSKSNNQFANTFSSNVEQAAAPKAAIAGMLDDFWVTLSAGLKYTGEVKTLNMTQGFYFNYAGLGYANPGNPNGTRGSFQYGLNLKRSWNKNKAMMAFRADKRDIDRSALGSGSKWKNLQLSLDGRYRFTRHLTMSVRLNQGSMNEVADSKATNVFLNRKLTVSSQMNGKFGEIAQSQVAMLGIQQMNYVIGTAPVKSTLLNLNMMQSLSLGQGVVSFNTLVSQDLSGNMDYGNMITSDAGYNYMLWKSLSCGSSITFLDTKGIARQAGLRQSIGAQLMKRLALNCYVDARKDLIKSANSFLYGNFRTEMTLHYLLN